MEDVLVLISNSGNSEELKNIIQYANRHKIKLISIVSKKNSLLYKTSDIQLLLPDVEEAGHGIVPTASTCVQLSIGDALAISLMRYKRFGKLDFKKFHPAGSLGNKLKTVEDLMLTKQRIPETYPRTTTVVPPAPNPPSCFKPAKDINSIYGLLLSRSKSIFSLASNLFLFLVLLICSVLPS